MLSLLVLPAVPLLIFATAACRAAAAGVLVGGYLAMLAAFLTASATLSVRHRRCAAADRAITRCACGRGHHNRVSKRLCGKRYINWRSRAAVPPVRMLDPRLAALSALLLVIGPGGAWLRPADYQQGESYRIMYLHVPTAMWSMGLYGDGRRGLRRGGLADQMADSAIAAPAPVGRSAPVALVSGAAWGKPMWGPVDLGCPSDLGAGAAVSVCRGHRPVARL